MGPSNATKLGVTRISRETSLTFLLGWAYPYNNNTQQTLKACPTLACTHVLLFPFPILDDSGRQFSPACSALQPFIPLSTSQSHVCQSGSIRMLSSALVSSKYLERLCTTWSGSQSRCASCSSYSPQRKSSTNLLDPDTLQVVLVAVRLSMAA